MTDKPTQELKPCPWCGTKDHITLSRSGSMTADMPNRPYKLICTHIDHDTVEGPVAYGKTAAIAAWNTRSGDATKLLREIRDWGLAPAFSTPMQEVRSDLIASIDAHLEGEA